MCRCMHRCACMRWTEGLLVTRTYTRRPLRQVRRLIWNPDPRGSTTIHALTDALMSPLYVYVGVVRGTQGQPLHDSISRLNDLSAGADQLPTYAPCLTITLQAIRLNNTIICAHSHHLYCQVLVVSTCHFEIGRIGPPKIPCKCLSF